MGSVNCKEIIALKLIKKNTYLASSLSTRVLQASGCVCFLMLVYTPWRQSARRPHHVACQAGSIYSLLESQSDSILT